MYFSSLPEAYAPVGAPLRYALTGGTSDETLVRIFADGDRLLGTKRFTEPQPVGFDIGPCVRGALRFAPEAGPTGVLPADERVLTVVVEAENGAECIRSVARTFTAGDRPAAAPALLTTLPPNRLIAPDGCDELTLLAAGPMQITVEADNSGVPRRYAVASAGVHRFRLSAADFPGAAQLTVGLGPCGTVRYTVLPPPDGAQCVAWRSRAGSLEHYTFPVVQRVGRRVVRQRACDAEGQIVVHGLAGGEQVELRGACETASVLAGLAGLLDAPEVWWLDASGYRPVDVLTEQAELHRYGALRALTITVRSTRPDEPLWSC